MELLGMGVCSTCNGPFLSVAYFFVMILNNTDVQFFYDGKTCHVSCGNIQNVYENHGITTVSVKLNHVFKIL